MKSILKFNKIKSKLAYSAIEMLVAVTVLALVSGGAYYLFKGSVKMSETGTKMMDYYQKAQKIVMRLSRDIKEANYVKPEAPIMIPQSQLNSLGITPETQKLEIVKQKPDFTKQPTGPSKHVEYTEEVITYKVEPMPGEKEYKLIRQVNGKNDEEIATNIAELLFYRIEAEEQTGGQKIYGTGPNTIYIRLKLFVPSAGNDPNIKGYPIEYKTAISLRGCQL